MKRTILIAILMTLVAATSACKTEEKADTTEPEKTAAEMPEGEEGAGEEEAAGEEEPAGEADGEEAAGEEGAGEEAPKAEAEPGTIPFEYPKVATTAKAGEYVLAPPRDWIDKGFEKGGDKQTFIFYSAEVIESGDVQTKLKKIGKEEEIPNSMIIPIPKGEKAKTGDVLLTWWQSGSGMKRAVVVGGSETEPVVRYLDVDLDNPSGLGTKEDTLKPDSFKVLTKEMEPGTAVAIKQGNSYKHGIVVNEADGKVLTVGFAGRMAVSPKADVTPLPVKPNVKKGDKVWVPFVGTFREATVTKVDPKIGRVFTTFKFANKDKEMAAAFGNVATNLEGGAEDAGETPAAEAKPEEKKDAKPNYAGNYKGQLNGTHGIKGQITLTFAGNKVSGNLKGQKGDGEKFLTGLSGSLTGDKFTASGNNKNTKLVLTGNFLREGKAKGILKGQVNGKKETMTFEALR